MTKKESKQFNAALHTLKQNKYEELNDIYEKLKEFKERRSNNYYSGDLSEAEELIFKVLSDMQLEAATEINKCFKNNHITQ